MRSAIAAACQDGTTTPHGMIDLTRCSVKSANTKAKRENAFEVCAGETVYLMVADSKKEKKQWVEAIQRAIDNSGASERLVGAPQDTTNDDEATAATAVPAEVRGNIHRSVFFWAGPVTWKAH
jgi:hypothetical protein